MREIYIYTDYFDIRYNIPIGGILCGFFIISITFLLTEEAVEFKLKQNSLAEMLKFDEM